MHPPAPARGVRDRLIDCTEEPALETTGPTIGDLPQAHLSGRAPVRKVVPVPPQDDSDTSVELEIELDRDYYDRGTAARRRDHESLGDLDDIFAKLEQRVEVLLVELGEVLEE